MLNLINRNKNYFESLDYKNINLNYKQKIINSIKNNNTIIIKGFYNSLKTNLISYIITNSNYKSDYLYINKTLDLDNLIKNNNYLEFILRHLEDFQNKPKIIILENISNIKNIKNFIDYLSKNNYKTIIISNKISTLKNNDNEINIKQNIKYNFTPHSISSKKKEEITELLNKKELIILEEIVKPYNLKNIDLYKYTLTFLSKLGINSSVREINRNLNKNIKISLITMIEYLKFSEESKIIKQIKTFDFKKNKQIETKAKYYFTDTDFRNSLYNFELDEVLLKQNFLFSELDKRGYEINSGNNGSYDFDFYGISTLTKPLSGILTPSQEQGATKSEITTVFIDFCKSADKKEIKKQINKLLKVPEKPINPLPGIPTPSQEQEAANLTQTFSKYLIIDNPKEIGIQKTQYENLKIISFDELLKLI